MQTDMAISPRAIRNWRIRRGLAVNELAELAGITPSALARIEKGERRRGCRFTTLRALAAALEVEIADLLHEVPAADNEGVA